MNQLDSYGTNTIPVISGWLGSWQISLNRRAFSNDELSYHYDDYANRWDQVLQRLDYPEKYNRLFCSLNDQQSMVLTGDRLNVLDCGVGTGEFSTAFMRVWKRNVDLHAIDISPSMLAQAKNNLRQANVNCELKLCDAQKLTYQDDKFDLTMTAHMLEHFVDHKQAIQEMIRVTKPGGYVLACMSKRSLFGRFVQLKWRTHLVSSLEAKNLFTECGLENVFCLPIRSKRNFSELSIAVLGTKRY